MRWPLAVGRWVGAVADDPRVVPVVQGGGVAGAVGVRLGVDAVGLAVVGDQAAQGREVGPGIPVVGVDHGDAGRGEGFDGLGALLGVLAALPQVGGVVPEVALTLRRGAVQGLDGFGVVVELADDQGLLEGDLGLGYAQVEQQLVGAGFLHGG